VEEKSGSEEETEHDILKSFSETISNANLYYSLTDDFVDSGAMINNEKRCNSCIKHMQNPITIVPKNVKMFVMDVEKNLDIREFETVEVEFISDGKIILSKITSSEKDDRIIIYIRPENELEACVWRISLRNKEKLLPISYCFEIKEEEEKEKRIGICTLL